VTSASSDEAPNFQSEKHMAHDDRYARAREFFNITCGLWDSWEDDAFPRDQESGVYLDHSKLHYLNYNSEMFSVRGPLNSPRPPQGRPVIFQAGSSDIGRELGAETADAIFTAQETVQGAQAFYADVKGRAARLGRNPDELLIFVGIGPVVGRTMAEAQAKFDLLQSKLTPEVALHLLSEVLAVDLSGIPIDQPVTDLPRTDGMQSRRDLLLAKALAEKMTLLELSRFVAGGRGHRLIIGTPETIADDFQHWWESKATDGFLLAPPCLPGALQDFVDLVVPELQRRGIFKKDYSHATLRETLGLRRPPHPVAAAASRQGSRVEV
jgi:alkanesulfonate monooxygenase